MNPDSTPARVSLRDIAANAADSMGGDKASLAAVRALAATVAAVRAVVVAATAVVASSPPPVSVKHSVLR